MNKSSLVAALAVAGALSSQAALFNFSATLSGAEEVPANNSPASGFVSATYDSVSGQFSLGGVFGGLTTPATAAHVHAGAVGVNGPVILPLTIVPGGSTSGGLVGVFPDSLTPNQVAGLFAENWYVNVHTSSFPGGEIRGQLQLTPVPEPETYAAMAGVALVGFGIWRRQRR